MGQVTLSPAAALAAAAAPPASEVVLKTLGSDPVYQVFLGPGRSVLVHGSTGAIVTLTPARAESLAFGAGAARGRVPELIEAHSRRYPSGPLPVWRFAADTPGEFLDVSTRDGAIERTSGVVRLRRSISEWHTFGPLRRVVGGRITHLSLLGTSLLAFVMVATGYVLIFPRRRSQD
jgi:hypothetical protein